MRILSRALPAVVLCLSASLSAASCPSAGKVPAACAPQASNNIHLGHQLRHTDRQKRSIARFPHLQSARHVPHLVCEHR
jgi:hypothetical protein